MKCVLPGGNVKILAKAIHMLAKIGDEMYVNPQEGYISFRTVNMAKSAYSDFTFHKNFFSYYALGNLEEEEAQKCKISMRSAMTVFKSAHILDKQVETCHIQLEVDACDLVFILKYKNGIKKSHLAPILDSEKLQASYTKAGMSNELIFVARTLTEALQNFPQNLFEITLEVTPQKLLLRNYVDDTSAMVNITRSQLALGVGEFDRYAIENETSVTFCLKEARALLAFSETASVPVTASFGTAGRPILFTLKSQAFETNLLLSTLNPDCDSQSDVSLVSRQMRPVRRRNASSKSTSKCVNKSSSRVKKPTKPTKPKVNDVLKSKPTEERNQSNKTLNQNTSVNVASVNNSISNVRERNLHMPEQSRRSVTPNPANTSSATDRKVLDSQRKLINSVFSSITKRKSRNDEKEEEVAEEEELVDLEESVPQSPPRRQAAKRAKLVFQKCFHSTFDPRMLPGHDVILVEDSDENNSD
ncbi:PREDICTED: cell cycle checkpoint control protein RAD9A [Vollenhovia emeryi]|uniref:cell cycle checkpoint control protein RAD9A n=1 Tax=Vollenhovia emeryi TaxID=411798 RepID=UPI0005F3CDA3|nr:PREDICTED: cell cycle checkpoint control protein RAD9A [Vollenhovia emeryi]